MAAQAIRAGRAYVEVGADDSKLQRGLRRAQRRLSAFGSALQGVGLRVAAAGSAMLAPFAAAVSLFNRSGDALDKMAGRTGVSVEALSELAHAADTAGTSIDAVEGGIRKMQRTITEAVNGSKSAQEALAELGLTAEELKDLKPEDQFELIAQRISSIQDPTRRAAAAMEVLGKSATELLPLLASVQAGRAEARALGLTIPTEAATRAADLNDALGRTSNVAKNAAFWVGDALAPALTWTSNAATVVLMRVRDWLKEHPRVVSAVAGTALALVGLGSTLATTGLVVRGLAFAMGGLRMAIVGVTLVARVCSKAFRMLWSSAVLPVALLIAGVVVLLHYTGQLAKLLGWIGKLFTSISDEINGVIEKFPALKDFLNGGSIDFDFDLDAIRKELSGLTASGTFSGTAVAQLAGSRSVGERTAKAAEESARTLKRIEENTSAGAPRFE